MWTDCKGGQKLPPAGDLPLGRALETRERLAVWAVTIDKDQVVAQLLRVIEAAVAHQSDHMRLHMFVIEFDREHMDHEGAEIDRAQNRQFAPFRVDAEIGDLAEAALACNLVQPACFDGNYLG